MSEPIKVKSEPTDDMDIPENYFDDLTSNTFLDNLVSCIPAPKKEALSEGECSDEEPDRPQNCTPAVVENNKPAQNEVIPPPSEKTQQTPNEKSSNQPESEQSAAPDSAPLPAANEVEKTLANDTSVQNDKTPEQSKTTSSDNASNSVATIKSEPTEAEQTNSTKTPTIASVLPKPIIQIIKNEPGETPAQSKPVEPQAEPKPLDQQPQSKPLDKAIKPEPLFQASESEPLYQPPDAETMYQPPESEVMYQPPEPESIYQPPEPENLYQPQDLEGQIPTEITPKPKITNFPIPIRIPGPGIKREKKSPSPPIQMIPFKKIKLEKQSNSSHIEKGYKTCKDVLRTFKEEEKRRFISKFVFTPTTIRIKNLNDEYQSPLLRNNNIEFNFTSTNSKIDFRKMSIMRFGKEVTRVVDLLGLDINNVAKKVLRTESRKSSAGRQSTSAESSSGQYYAPFYNEVATQTETIACNECLIRKLKSHKDKEVMAKPETAGIGIQTGMENELPIMSIITTLNTYQQVALNDFAEVMKEPPPTDPNDIYRLRERLMDILNLSRRTVSRGDEPRPKTNVYVQRPPAQNMMPMSMHQQNPAPGGYPYPGNQSMMHQPPSNYHENDHHMIPGPPNFPQNHQNMMPNHQGMPQHQGYPHQQLKREHAMHMAAGTSRPSDDPRRRQRPTDNMHDLNYMTSYQLQNQHEMQSAPFEEMPTVTPSYNNRSFGRGAKVMRK